MHSDMNCEALQHSMRQGRALTAEERTHVDGCEACLNAYTEAWLDSAVVTALEAKPKVHVPEGFAAKVVAGLSEQRVAARKQGRRYAAPWGLITAAGLIGAGLVAAVAGDAAFMTTRMGVIFEGLVAAEIAAIALWLGVGQLRRG